MENAVRVIITILFIGLIALAVIFFAVFGLIPLGQAGKVFEKSPTSTVEVVVIDPGSSSGGEEEPGETPPEAVTPPPTNNGDVVVVPPNTEETPPVQNPPAEEPPVVAPPDITPVEPPPPKVIKLDVPPGSSEAPEQSNPVAHESLPDGVIDIVTQGGGLSITEFTVVEGEEMTLAFTSADGNTHVLAFRESALQAVAIGVGPGETRTMTFKAPEAGIYNYYCNVPGHAGERGIMRVLK